MPEFPKIDLKYLKEAFNEPLNFLGLVSFAVVGAFTMASSHDVTPLAAGLAAETVYLVTVPASSLYRRLVDRREKQRLMKLRDQQREAAIKLFDPREREAGVLALDEKPDLLQLQKIHGLETDSFKHSKPGSALG